MSSEIPGFENMTLAEQMRARQQLAKKQGTKPKKVAEIFQREADNYKKYTTQLPIDLIARLKMRALEEKTTPAKLITEVLEDLLSRPARDPDAAKKEQERRRMIT
ncbi:ParB-like dsDNA partitioning protein [Gordonia phage Soups]|uniref:ParB-like dsDNA partitioning protein n=1 Tax=Gordonia phage Soups TaxID=1838079 RepID=A0A160DG83_9CAUD|nr:Arc-like repressor [Gordonia phage Soups]ANA86972.1 ParB-like dsDNA partitioning protein [Gordonia phage Soups]